MRKLLTVLAVLVMATGMTITPAQTAGPMDNYNLPTITDPVFDDVGSTDMVWSTPVVLSSQSYTVLEVTDLVGLVHASEDISTVAQTVSVPSTDLTVSLPNIDMKMRAYHSSKRMLQSFNGGMYVHGVGWHSSA